MRIAIVDTYYPAFVSAFYAGHPGLAQESYERQHAALMSASFGTADAYSVHLRALGHEAIDLVADCAPLQQRWAAERGRRIAGLEHVARLPAPLGPRAARLLLRRITIAQLAEFSPDVVYCHNLAFFSRPEFDAMRRRGWLVAGQVASPLPPMRLVTGFDVIYTSFPHFVPRLRAAGVGSDYLPLAVDERIVERLAAAGTDPSPAADRPHDVVFVGGVHPGVHAAGTALLERLCESMRVDVWGYGADALPATSAIRRHHHGEAWGLDMYRALASGKVAVNRHIDVAEGHANNMRLYEATAVGAAVVTEAAPNLAELFEPGHDVATYDGVEGLVEVIGRLVSRDAERISIAAAGQQRTLRQHTFSRRMAELAALLEARLEA